MLNILTPVQRLERIRTLLDHPAIDCSDVVRRFRGLLKDIRYRKHPYVIRIPTLVRATCHFDELWFNNVSKLTYPPKEVLLNRRNFGRCNWPTEAVFYCSSETGVPIFEVRPKIGQYVVLSHWESKISDKIELYGVALGVEAIMNSLSENDAFLSTLQQDDVFKDTVSQEIKDVDRYVAKLFVEDASADEKIYWFTSAVAKTHFEYLVFESTGMKINALLYPSVATQLNGYNVALTKNFVDANLHPKEARMYQVIDFDEKALEYKLKPIKKVKGVYSITGELVWEYVSNDISDQIWILSPQSPSVLI